MYSFPSPLLPAACYQAMYCQPVSSTHICQTFPPNLADFPNGASWTMNFDATRLTATGSLHKDSFDSTRLTACCPQHASRKHTAPSRDGTFVSCCGERNTVAAQQTTQLTDAVMA